MPWAADGDSVGPARDRLDAPEAPGIRRAGAAVGWGSNLYGRWAE